MLRIIKKRKGQNTAEYAILISLVVAGIIAMQTYAQRALQGRVQAAAKLFSDQGTSSGSATLPTEWQMDSVYQYEPYYLDSSYEVTRDSREAQILEAAKDKDTPDTIRTEEGTNRVRALGGYQKSDYNVTTFGGEAF